MKQSILFLTATFFFALSSSAQFDKKNWLVGGNGSFKSLNNNFQSNNADWEYKITDIKLDEKGGRSNFSFLAGPAIYFNSSVAIEFLAGYIHTMEEISSQTYGNPYKQIDKGFQFAIGLQIHLEKL